MPPEDTSTTDDIASTDDTEPAAVDDADPIAGDDAEPTVLLPIEVLEGESIPEGTAALLANVGVVLLGYHVVPEQTAPGQARMQFEERALERLDELSSLLAEAGAEVETRLVFTHEAQATIDRTIEEEDCLAVLLPKAIGSIDDVLVAIRGDVGLDRMTRLVAGVFGDSDATLTLYHIDDPEAAALDQDLMAAARERLASLGVSTDRIETKVERHEKPVEAITAASTTADVLVIGESDPSLVTFVFGMPAKQVAEQFLGPVLVVQREPERVAGEAATDEEREDTGGEKEMEE